MKVKSILIIMFLICLGCSKEGPSELVKSEKMMVKHIPNKSITIEQLKEMFNNISVKTDWDMNGPMLWGYFFTHHEKSKLEQAKTRLEDQGYRYVDIFLADKDVSTDPDLWFLHVEKIETHSPKSLGKRNDEFYVFAEKFGLDSYDGMDVGPVKQ